MSYSLTRINPNQTQVFFDDGRIETLTDQELEFFLREVDPALEESTTQHVTD